MRSLFVSNPKMIASLRQGRSASVRTLRTTLATVLLGGLALLGTGSAARADEPAVSDEVAPPTTVTQSTTTTTTVTAMPPAAAAPAPVLAPAVVAPVAPAPLYTPPPAPVVAAPVAPLPPPGAPIYLNGPIWVIPAQPGVQPVLPQQLPPPPVFVQPSTNPNCLTTPQYQPYRRAYVAPLRRPLLASRSAYQAPRGPAVGMGLRFSAIGISSQEVFGEKVSMMGAGLQLRFRNQGHWGFELGMDVLRANIGDGAFVRTSYPFSFAPMLYLFKNRPENHFNLYAVAGFGLMADDVKLYEGSRQERRQQFWEVLGHVGGGAELRFKHLALFADIRALGMLLDDSSHDGQFYQGVEGGPIPASSLGYKANAGAMLWF
ncbi:MAG: hypothetical protein U1A78_28240 [Polyangia bacterium]